MTPDSALYLSSDMEIDFERRFGAVSRLYGTAGALAIQASHVVVVGIGGVGSWAAESLARSGVGSLSLIDMDHVAESNINRQVHADSETVGMSKVQAMAQRIRQINPNCVVNCVEQFVNASNWPGIVPIDNCAEAGFDAVIDACDQVLAKTAMAVWALSVAPTGTKFVTVGAAGGKRLAHKVDIADLAKVTHDPILAKVRYALRRHFDAAKGGLKIGIDCVYSQEVVSKPMSDGLVAETLQNGFSLSCQGYGSLVCVTATFGQCAAGWVLDQIALDANKKQKFDR